jgi:hypothetical protein
MHHEQRKCRLRYTPIIPGARAVTPPPDFSTFSSHLRSAGLNLLPHMLITAVLDVCRGTSRKHHRRARRRHHESTH